MSNRLTKSQPESPRLAGKLLVASPFVRNYQPDVFLILQDSGSDVFGVNLSNEATEDLAEAWENVTGVSFNENQLIHGGPQPGPVLAIHSNSGIADQQISRDLYLSTQTQSIGQLIESSEQFRIVFGAVTWKKIQLDVEIQSGVWLTITPDLEDIFESPDEIWFRGVRKYGFQTLADLLGIRQFPESSILN